MFGKKGQELAVYLCNNVEDNLPENLKELKRKAFSGDADAQYQIGIHYKKYDHDTGYMAAGIQFLAQAAKRGHNGAREIFRQDGYDWQEFV